VLGRRENHWIFEVKVRSYQDLEFYFLRTLYSWNHTFDIVTHIGTKLAFLNFVDNIVLSSMRA